MKLTIITPCFNEELNIIECASRVASVMASSLPQFEYEHIFCDNASTDDSVNILREIAANDPRIKVIVNSRNVGPFRNMANGLKSASGDLIVPMVPADLQDPPEIIPEMVAKLTSGVDVVYGVRTNRKENFLMRKARGTYYNLIRRTSGGTTPPPHAGEFLLARKHVIDVVLESLGSYPYIRGLVSQATQRYETVPYVWGIRENGKSRNSIPDLFDQALNGLVSTARTPIRWALLIGVIMSIVGFIAGLVNLGVFLFGSVATEPGVPTLIVGMFLFGGVQLFFLGLIGEYVVSIQSEVRPSPGLIEVERLNF